MAKYKSSQKEAYLKYWNKVVGQGNTPQSFSSWMGGYTKPIKGQRHRLYRKSRANKSTGNRKRYSSRADVEARLRAGGLTQKEIDRLKRK